MNARFDDQSIRVSKKFQNALIEVLKAECEMMVASGGDAAYWYWGRATIVNLSDSDGIRFEYGGKEDKPRGPRFAVIIGGEK